MKRNSKRFLSLFLAVPMTLSLMSMPVSAAPTGSADQQVQEETAAPETSEDTQEDADTDTAEETQDSAAGADQESSRTETDTETSAADNAGEDAEISINLEDSLTTFTVDASKIEAPEITPNEMQLSEEELDAVDTSDPEIATIEEELKSIKVYVESERYISASCEFFYTDEDCLRFCLERFLPMLSIISKLFNKRFEESKRQCAQ